jgi:hypothetical protein
LAQSGHPGAGVSSVSAVMRQAWAATHYADSDIPPPSYAPIHAPAPTH